MPLVPSRLRPLSAPLLPAVALYGHADGFSWDEALMVLAPIAIIAAVLLYANNKVKRVVGSDPAAEDDPGSTEATRPGGHGGAN